MRIGYEAKRIYHNHSGLGNYGRNLIRSLAVHFPEEEYFLYNPKKAKINFGTDLPAVTEQNPGFKNPIYLQLWRQSLLADRARKDKVDIFHGLSQQLPMGISKKGITSVVSVHDLIFKRYPKLYKRIDRNIYAGKLKHACRYADKIVAISEQTKNDLHDFLNVPLDKIQVIYQSCDPLYLKDYKAEELRYVREKYNLPNEYLLFVGTLEQRKNPDSVLRISQKLNIPLVLVGRTTKYWKSVLKNFRDLNVKLIHHPSVREDRDLAAIYRMANIFIYPSTFEGFGIPVLEALSSRVPVITSRESSLPEIAGPGSILIKPGNDEELESAVLKVLNSEELQKEMQQSGFHYASYFSEDKLAAKWHTLYSSLL